MISTIIRVLINSTRLIMTKHNVIDGGHIEVHNNNLQLARQTKKERM